MTRKGLEDYEYLKALENATKTLINRLPAKIAATIKTDSISMEYAAAVAKTSSQHMADGTRLIKIRNALIDELLSIRSAPLGAAHYEFKNGKIILRIFAPPGTVAKVDCIPHTINETGIKQIDLLQEKWAEKTIKILFSNGNASKETKKTFFKPFGATK
jgi:predicted transcriptional regulator